MIKFRKCSPFCAPTHCGFKLAHFLHTQTCIAPWQMLNPWRTLQRTWNLSNRMTLLMIALSQVCIFRSFGMWCMRRDEIHNPYFFTQFMMPVSVTLMQGIGFLHCVYVHTCMQCSKSYPNCFWVSCGQCH